MAEIRLKSTGTIKLFESDNTSNITIASPASLGADRIITLPDASVTLASGTMLATDGSGASLTALNASELGSGTVPTARLGSGTASSSTVLYGDQTYKAEPTTTLKIKQVVYEITRSAQTISTYDGTWTVINNPSPTITPTATDNKILIQIWANNNTEVGAYATCSYDFQRAISGGATTTRLAYESDNAATDGVGYLTNYHDGSSYNSTYGMRPYCFVDTTYNTTSACTYNWMADPYRASAGDSWFNKANMITTMMLTEFE